MADATFKQVASEEFFAGEARIAASAEKLLGPLSPHSPVGLMVTLPFEAADNAAFVIRLAELGVEAIRMVTSAL